MSSIRNAAPRRSHKERSQPAHRQKFGLLEKHKDYVVRAKDFHVKQNKLVRLRQIAAERNKDEFYFGMVKGKTKEGVHIQSRDNPVLPPDVVKLLKTQDANYVRTQAAANQRRIDELKKQLMDMADLEEGLDEEEREVLREAGLLVEQQSKKGKVKKVLKGSHVVFAESEEQARQYKPPSARPKTSTSADGDVDMDHPSLPAPTIDPGSLGWVTASASSPATPKDDDAIPSLPPTATLEERRAHRSLLLTALRSRQTRSLQLHYTLSELSLQRTLFTRGRPRKVREAVEVKKGKKAGEEGEEEEEEDEEGQGKEEKMWRPRVFKWKFMRRK